MHACQLQLVPGARQAAGGRRTSRRPFLPMSSRGTQQEMLLNCTVTSLVGSIKMAGAGAAPLALPPLAAAAASPFIVAAPPLIVEVFGGSAGFEGGRLLMRCSKRWTRKWSLCGGAACWLSFPGGHK